MNCCGVPSTPKGNGYFKCEICKGSLHDLVHRPVVVGVVGIGSKTVMNRIIELLEKQTSKGLAKYGHTLDDCPDDKYDWRLMALEELIDLVQYQQKEIIRLERLLNP
jgi:hypothetical protein